MNCGPWFESQSLVSVCSGLDKMIDAKAPPDIVLDATQTGDASDAIKSLTSSLGIPTISMSYGGKFDFRYRSVIS